MSDLHTPASQRAHKMSDTMGLGRLKAYVTMNKLWISLIGLAFSFGGVAASFALGQAAHTKITAEILSTTDVHARDVKMLLEQINMESTASRKVMEKILNVNTTVCINTARTEAGRTNCVK